MDAVTIQNHIDTILQALKDNPATEIVEYTIGDRTVRKNRKVLYEELRFWRAELERVNAPKRVIYTRF